ncbi:MAG TPA: PIG-L family deacetylase [Thermoanaerobaculia bacterium]|nr:PIG-L family deacetylase [Thermoanaerobaculia bacterium]
MSEQPTEDAVIPHRAMALEGERVLALAAHPDDETLGAGGELARIAAENKVVRLWIATDGELQEGSDGDRAAYGARRREEARRAAAALGLPEPAFGGMPDRELARRPADLERELARLIREFEPDLVICPSPVEIHPDHRCLAESLYRIVAGSRPGDGDHEAFQFLRVAFYELTQPLLPNLLVDIAAQQARKAEALACYTSQQLVRDYAGAVAGLNAYRRLTLGGAGPVEAFFVATYPEISARSLEQFRSAIGPSVFRSGSPGTAPVSIVVRTRNRPSLLAEALDSLRAQTARPREVVIVNDGGASVADVVAPFREAFAVVLDEKEVSEGRSRAANRGMEAARSELAGFLDDDDRCYPDHVERLVDAYRAGPEPVVYSDAATVVYDRDGDGWRERSRSLQYSLDFDPDYLLVANYIPLHTILLPPALYRKTGGFDPALDYSEDWDFLIRLSFATSFRHVRGVTCEYRVFAADDPGHAAAGSPAFLQGRRRIYERYADRRTPEGLGRVIDRLRTQIAFWYDRDGRSQGELRYQRASHRRLHELWEKCSTELGSLQTTKRDLEIDRSRLLAENELVHARVEELFEANERAQKKLSETYAEIQRLNGILEQIYVSRTWKLHLLLDRIRGRR